MAASVRLRSRILNRSYGLEAVHPVEIPVGKTGRHPRARSFRPLGSSYRRGPALPRRRVPRAEHSSRLGRGTMAATVSPTIGRAEAERDGLDKTPSEPCRSGWSCARRVLDHAQRRAGPDVRAVSPRSACRSPPSAAVPASPPSRTCAAVPRRSPPSRPYSQSSTLDVGVVAAALHAFAASIAAAADVPRRSRPPPARQHRMGAGSPAMPALACALVRPQPQLQVSAVSA